MICKESEIYMILSRRTKNTHSNTQKHSQHPITHHRYFFNKEFYTIKDLCFLNSFSLHKIYQPMIVTH